MEFRKEIDGNAAQVDALTAELSEGLGRGTMDCVTRVFAERGLKSPLVLWSPSRQDISHPVLRHFARDCASIMDDCGRVPEQAFNTLDLTPHRAWLTDVVPVGEDFQYRHYGDEIAALFGRNMTGKFVSDFDGFIRHFFAAMFRAVTARQQWALSIHEPPQNVFARAWNRMLVPLYDDNGQVVRIVGVNVGDCDFHDGLELVMDPVVVINADRQAVYANSAARMHFGAFRQSGTPLRANDYLGFALPCDRLKGALDHPSAASESCTKAVINGVIVDYHLALRPITFRDRPFVAAILRPY